MNSRKKIKTHLLLAKSVLLLAAGWLVSRTYKSKDLWLVCELNDCARDNGLWFFRYCKEQHPEINALYLIDKQSPDIKKLRPYNKFIVERNSFRHCLLLWKANKLISTHKFGYIPLPVTSYPKVNRVLARALNKKQTIFLQHGVAKDDLKSLYYSKTAFNLFICGAYPEYKFVEATFGYPAKNLAYTGLCRYDGLHDGRLKPQVLIMPTWRMWLNEENIQDSNYFNVYKQLLCHPELDRLLQANGLTAVFYPHYEMQKYMACFKDLPLGESIRIADGYSDNVQQLLKESQLLVTDYSSVFFDFAYMRKPTIYFQFDTEQYRKGHYEQGYFDYDKAFGPRCETMEQLLAHIRESIRTKFIMPEVYANKVEEFFPLHDTRNSQRVFERIIAL